MKRIAYIIAVCAALSAGAQDLSTEITVDRIIEPSQRAAYRPDWAPVPLVSASKEATLQPAEYMYPASVSTSLTTIPAALWGDTIPYTPYRGYASIGYFPSFNLGANAGYRFVDTQRATLGAWIQYDGNKYSRLYPVPEINAYAPEKPKLGNSYFNYGAYMAFRPNSYSRFGLDANMMLASVTRPSWISPDGNKQRASQLSIGADWFSHAFVFDYYAALRFGFFGFGSGDLDVVGNDGRTMARVKQSMLDVKAGLSMPLNGVARKVGIDIDDRLLHANNRAGNLNETHLRPYVMLGSEFSLRAGVNLSIATGTFDNGVQLSPDVRLAWDPVRLPIAASVYFSGAETLNPVGEMFAVNPYLSTVAHYGRTNVPFAVDADVCFGPVSGFSLSVYGAFANARNVMLPIFTGSGQAFPVWASAYGGTLYNGFDAKCWRIGAKAAYEYRGLASAYVGYEAAGSNDDFTSWYKWCDRAKSRLYAGLELRPIDKLSLNVTYDARSGRRGLWVRANSADGSPALQALDLLSANLLGIGAKYSVNDQLTVFANLDNVLNSKYLLVSGAPAQGLHGLVGAAYKF